MINSLYLKPSVFFSKEPFYSKSAFNSKDFSENLEDDFDE